MPDRFDKPVTKQLFRYALLRCLTPLRPLADWREIRPGVDGVQLVHESRRAVFLPQVAVEHAWDRETLLRQLALKAFYPAKPPFPLLHVDTTWKFKEMYEFRDNYVAKELGLDLIVHINEEGLKHNIMPWEDSERHTELMKTDALKAALDKYEFDAAFGGARPNQKWIENLEQAERDVEEKQAALDKIKRERR